MQFLKILKIGVSESKKEKEKKIRGLFEKIKASQVTHYFSPIALIKLDDKLVENLVAVDSIE